MKYEIEFTEQTADQTLEFHYKKRGDGKVETGVIERWG